MPTGTGEEGASANARPGASEPLAASEQAPQAVPRALDASFPVQPEVVAFVGASGTGKSHHAAEALERVGADALVDDGLLIADGEILAGRSAKREVTRLAAVRRAIFSDPKDAAQLREALARLRPRRVLILGTSEHMTALIAERLGLPPPRSVLRIEDVVSEADIQAARRTRREEGKHVIPAPTLQVKKTFPGYLVDPLRLWFSSSAREHRMVEKSIVRPSYSALGRISIASRAVGQVAQEAARRAGVGGVEVLHTHVTVGQDGVQLALDIRLAGQGQPLWARLEALQREVVAAVEEWTALSVDACEITLRDLTPPRRSRSALQRARARRLKSPGPAKGRYHVPPPVR